jgi:hypothetical protein
MKGEKPHSTLNTFWKPLYAGLSLAPHTEHLPSAVIIGCLPTSFLQSPHFKTPHLPKKRFHSTTTYTKYSIKLFLITQHTHPKYQKILNKPHPTKLHTNTDTTA